MGSTENLKYILAEGNRSSEGGTYTEQQKLYARALRAVVMMILLRNPVCLGETFILIRGGFARLIQRLTRSISMSDERSKSRVVV